MQTHPSYKYQVGGSLPPDAPSYVYRQADDELYTVLCQKQFCYVLDARQMGKSSLRVRTMRRLQREGIHTGVIDMTSIGSQQLTPEQWYASIIKILANNFELSLNLRSWWQERSHLSFVKRLSDFLEEVLLTQITQNIVIFIDEIDSVLGLKFPVDDFFALLRTCYNKRAEQPIYNRLTFGLFGVATPGLLISDKSRTPFNIGHAIQLKGFKFQEALPLLQGLKGQVPQPESLLEHILDWTAGQPFLTQKLCHLALNAKHDSLSEGNEALWVTELVQARILDQWEIYDEPEHLRTISTRLLRNEQRAGRLLGLYQQILGNGEHTELTPVISPSSAVLIDNSDNSYEQIDLLLSGLVVKVNGYLTVRNKIYAAIFDLEWVGRQLVKCRPYTESLNAWLNSNCVDESRLLRGQALHDAQIWAQDKSLTDQDYQFLAASEKLAQLQIQQALELARAEEVTARLIQEKQTAKLQRYLLAIVSLASLVIWGLGLTAFWQYRVAKLSEIKAISRASEALFASHQGLDALVAAIEARQRLLALGSNDSDTVAAVESALRQAVYGVVEYNRLSGHQATVYSVAISPDGQMLASASQDGTVKLWTAKGKLLHTLRGHRDWVTSVVFSPDGQSIVSGSKDKTLKLWQRDGHLIRTIQAHQSIWKIALSKNGQFLATASWQGQAKIWRLDGHLVSTLELHSPVWAVAFSPDGQQLATGGADKTVKLWSLDGKLLKTLRGHRDRIHTIVFSPDGQLIASGSKDNTVKLWRRDGKLIYTHKGHSDEIWHIAFSPDSQRIASTSSDRTVQIWQRDGTLLKTLNDYGGRVFEVTFSPDGKWLASTNSDATIKFWQLDNQLLIHLGGHSDWAVKVAFSPDGQLLASTSADKTVKLWKPQGQLVKTFKGHRSTTVPVIFSPNGKLIASATEDDGIIKLWQPDGKVIATLPGKEDAKKGHQAGIMDLAFSPDGQILASASLDKTAKLWRPNGILLSTLIGHQKEVLAVAFSPNGQILATSSWDGTIKFWHQDGSLLRTIGSEQANVQVNVQAHVNDVTFSPDGKLLAAAYRDKTIKLWTLDGKLLRTLTGHRADVTALAFSPDGQLIASASRDTTIKIWHTDGANITTLNAHTNTISGISFSPNGQLLASASWDKTVIIWDLNRVIDVDKIMTFGCHLVKDYLHTNADRKESDNLCQNSP